MALSAAIPQSSPTISMVMTSLSASRGRGPGRRGGPPAAFNSSSTVQNTTSRSSCGGMAVPPSDRSGWHRRSEGGRLPFSRPKELAHGVDPFLPAPAEPLDADRVLGDEHVLTQRWNPTVVGELPAPVARLGRGGEDLDDDVRVEQRVDLVVFELGFPAEGREVGIGVEAGCVHADAHIAHIRLAWPVLELRADLPNEVPHDQAMLAAGP